MCFSDYLFKMVLIGDTHVGKSCLLIRFAVSQNTENQIYCSRVIFLLRFWIDGFILHWLILCLLGWLLSRELYLHHWSRFQIQNPPNQSKHYQVTNLGHSWSRALSHHHKCILQGRRWNYCSLRLDQQRKLFIHSCMAERNRETLRLWCQNHGLCE